MTSRDMALRSAFWSGNLTYRKWRGILRRGPQGHMRVFVQAFLHLPMDWLLEELGDERFISVWPQVREEFGEGSPSEMVARDAWDAIWGVVAAGDSQYPVSPEVAHLSKKRREVLKALVRNPCISTYALARMLGRNYSRVLKDVRILSEMDEVRSRPDPSSSRKAKRLLPVHSINTRLIGAASRA